MQPGIRPTVLMMCITVAGTIAMQAAAGEPAPQEDVKTSLPPELARQMEEATGRGLAYLAATQRPDGGWELMGQSDPAITALATRCFIQAAAYGPEHPVVERGVEFILRYRQPDGGIYLPDAGLPNYYTSVCLATLARLDDPKLEPVIAQAQQFLKGLQWDEQEDIDRANAWYGGAGYGRNKRPDLSNTQMMIEALRESGLPADDPTMQKAMTFVSRCQMNSASNDQAFARGADDGGFIYTPANGGESKAGYNTVEGGQKRLRSYGSMTYAGFKSMLYADVDREDERVKAAYEWIRSYYTLTSNPNMPKAQSKEGLYYYYHVFAKALRAWGEPTLTDAEGMTHDWREELCARLAGLQNRDGSWVNEADRWYESNPALVTSYALLAMQAALE
ncbi:MAG: terpene cyclase/mutase family protein [Phycisphaerales bacterium]|nr:MAG: terpene cyclase/mutase family protein [Phycisphaerales bacterium]